MTRTDGSDDCACPDCEGSRFIDGHAFVPLQEKAEASEMSIAERNEMFAALVVGGKAFSSMSRYISALEIMACECSMDAPTIPTYRTEGDHLQHCRVAKLRACVDWQNLVTFAKVLGYPGTGAVAPAPEGGMLPDDAIRYPTPEQFRGAEGGEEKQEAAPFCGECKTRHWNHAECGKDVPPSGSCLICGKSRPFVVWQGGVGACNDCRTAALAVTQQGSHPSLRSCVICLGSCCTVDDCKVEGHGDSCQLHTEEWVCSEKCWERAASKFEVGTQQDSGEFEKLLDELIAAERWVEQLHHAAVFTPQQQAKLTADIGLAAQRVVAARAAVVSAYRRVEQERDEGRAASRFFNDLSTKLSARIASLEATLESLKEVLEKIANQDWPVGRAIVAAHKMRFSAAAALAATGSTEATCPHGEQLRSPCVECPGEVAQLRTDA